MQIFRAKNILFFAAMLAVALRGAFASPADSFVDTDEKRILCLSSFEMTDRYYQEQANCLAKTLPQNYKIFFQFVSSLDLGLGPKEYEGFDNFYGKFLAMSKIDFIVAADTVALKFVQEKRDVFFKGLPVVAVGVGRGSEYDYAQSMSNTHIVMDEPYIEENIKLINSLFPRRRRIVFLGGDESQRRFINTIEEKFDI